MAGRKKQPELTAEEKLQQALVPEAEQPYKVPDNWCWTRVSFIANWASGGTPSRKNKEFYLGNIPWLKTGELNNNFIFDSEEHITEEALQKSSAKIFPVNSVLIAMYGATIGKVGILGVEAATNQACACAQCNETTNFKYLFYYLISQKDVFISKGQGGAQPNISQEIIKPHVFPLPPLAEQQRIVERIEALFAKLDEAKEKLQNTLDTFETRKAAILHKAFTGELTANWRKQYGLTIDSWEEKTLNDIASYKKGPFGSSITKAMFVPKTANTYKVYEQGNVIRKDLTYGHYYITSEKYQELKGFSVKAGDILISCAGTIGEVYKLPPECEEGVINQALMRVRLNQNIIEGYFCYYFGEIIKDDVIDKSNGTAMKNIPPFKVLKAIQIKLPTINEQTEIVRIIDNLLAKEQQAHSIAQNAIAQINLIKKSILARAFRGQLATNNPADEPAIELLKRVL